MIDNPVTIGNATLMQVDCMEYMATLPDNAFELAIVDPPYGIRAADKPIAMGKWKRNIHQSKNWDNSVPDKDYFGEVKRVSNNQIIWGGNYFLDYLSATRCFIVWDKNNGSNMMADCELAWTSFDSSVRKFTRSHIDDHNEGIGRIHPTQKPIKLYEWLLTNYATPGDRILDTHLGSCSSVIACLNMGYEITGCELDPDYFAAGVERVRNSQRQETLFTPAPPKQDQLTLEQP